MADDAVQLILTNITSAVAAVGALGTAAYGLVDTSKALRGGISNAGFGMIRQCIGRLLGEPPKPGDKPLEPDPFGTKDVLATLEANWLNGMAKADQKMAAKSLLRLCLTTTNTSRIAKTVGLDEAQLTAVVDKIRKGTALTPDDVNIIGRFDTIVSAMLDEAYESADQQYRNYSKLASAAVAIALAVIGGGILYCNRTQPPGVAALPHGVADYLASSQLILAILIGAISTPLAPIAKDISSALATAVKAAASWKR